MVRNLLLLFIFSLFFSCQGRYTPNAIEETIVNDVYGSLSVKKRMLLKKNLEIKNQTMHWADSNSFSDYPIMNLSNTIHSLALQTSSDIDSIQGQMLKEKGIRFQQFQKIHDSINSRMTTITNLWGADWYKDSSFIQKLLKKKKPLANPLQTGNTEDLFKTYVRNQNEYLILELLHLELIEIYIDLNKTNQMQFGCDCDWFGPNIFPSVFVASYKIDKDVIYNPSLLMYERNKYADYGYYFILNGKIVKRNGRKFRMEIPTQDSTLGEKSFKVNYISDVFGVEKILTFSGTFIVTK